MTRLSINFAAAVAFGLASSAAISKMSSAEPHSQGRTSDQAETVAPAFSAGASARYVSVGWFTRRVIAR